MFSLRGLIIRFILSAILILAVFFAMVGMSYLYLLNSKEIEKRIIDSTMLAYRESNNNTSDVNLLKSELRVLGVVDIDDETEKNEDSLPDNNMEEDSSSVYSFYAQKLSDSKYTVGSAYINSYL